MEQKREVPIGALKMAHHALEKNHETLEAAFNGRDRETFESLIEENAMWLGILRDYLRDR